MPRLSPEKIFLDAVSKTIKNLLINNPNYTNNYYDKKNAWDVIRDTKERASFILEKIEEIKHLIIPDDDD